jgi:hypothetical protein
MVTEKTLSDLLKLNTQTIKKMYKVLPKKVV